MHTTLDVFASKMRRFSIRFDRAIWDTFGPSVELKMDPNGANVHSLERPDVDVDN